MGSLQGTLAYISRVIKRGSIRLLIFEHDKVAVQKVDGLNTTFDKPPFPEQIDEPKAPALGLYASDVFHDLILLIPRTHIHGAQAHVLLLIHISILFQTAWKYMLFLSFSLYCPPSCVLVYDFLVLIVCIISIIIPSIISISESV